MTMDDIAQRMLLADCLASLVKRYAHRMRHGAVSSAGDSMLAYAMILLEDEGLFKITHSVGDNFVIGMFTDMETAHLGGEA